jgi:anthranilate phosphoribosyltransferase
MVSLPPSGPEDLVDTCGTGGGSINTFNISTAAALLVAGVGVRVAKHGNRSFTTQCGSADVLEALGRVDRCSRAVMESALRDAGIVFMFAPLMHPAMRHVGPGSPRARRSDDHEPGGPAGQSRRARAGRWWAFPIRDDCR